MIKRFRTEQFDYSKATRTFSQEASTLGEWPGDRFELVSQWGGRVAVFCLTETETDDEGDVLQWTWTPLRAGVKATRVSVVVFND